MKDVDFLRTVLICALIFLLSAVLAALLGKMIITDTVYYAVSADKDAVGFFGIIDLAKDTASASLFLLLFIFLSGFTVFSPASALLASIVRGVIFGYSVVSFKSGSAVAEGFLTSCVFFALTSFILLVFSAFSVHFFRYIRDEGVSFSAFCRYTALFLVFSGITVISDGARLIFI